VGRTSGLRYHAHQELGGEDRPVLNDDDEIPSPDGEPATMALDGVLDLHLFVPAEARALVDDWLDASYAAGLRDLRIIHGKGIGALRTMVHAALDARQDIESYGLAKDAGSWGATVIRMKS
jgi:DNA-nicking Smr family endonuclease